MQRSRIMSAAFLALLLASVQAGVAQDEIRRERVSFASGKSAATITGSIKGHDTVDYLLQASAGQQMSVTLKSNNSSNYFNLLPPGSDEAIFIGSSGGGHWSGTLAASGDYAVRVYLMRNAARRNETAKYTLEIGITAPQSTP